MAHSLLLQSFCRQAQYEQFLEGQLSLDWLLFFSQMPRNVQTVPRIMWFLRQVLVQPEIALRKLAGAENQSSVDRVIDVLEWRMRATTALPRHAWHQAEPACQLIFDQRSLTRAGQARSMSCRVIDDALRLAWICDMHEEHAGELLCGLFAKAALAQSAAGRFTFDGDILDNRIQQLAVLMRSSFTD